MAVPPAYHESLPYVDPEPSPEALAAARALITAEAATQPPKPSSHPEPSFSPAIAAELARVSNSTPLAPLDLSRYEAPSPSAPLPRPSPQPPLRTATSRRVSPTSNCSTDGVLERELAATKREVDIVNLERQKRQGAVGAEIKALDDTWRAGVGRVLETEVAVEELRGRIREELARRAAQGDEQAQGQEQ
ncbi:hypothetical protein MRS44_007692 [Fusarium solani]|uniref:uncharacterized protein n=1 Tax=Fusarium solani TaxID=169388 RepID=UPI0032C46797|nr:hypothetical protein MRS44_007692 [Fusarium solani]